MKAKLMKTHVEFRSDAFPPYEGEEEEINPGIYGKRLAEFLVRGLSEKGFRPNIPIPEDWGWIVPIENNEFPLWIGCANYEEYPDGFLCFIEPHQSLIRKFLFFGKIDTSERVEALHRVIDEILSAETSIIDKQWWSYEEFINPQVK